MDNSQEMQIVFSPEIYILQIQRLQEELLAKDAEINSLKAENTTYKELIKEAMDTGAISLDGEQTSKKRVRRPRPETSASEFKSDGKRKARAADSIRSYDDFKAMQDYFWSHGKIRDWMMWTIGVSLGLRISDLLSLKFENFFESDRATFREKIHISEQKTGKINDLLITEAVKHAILTYCESIKYQFDLGDYLFPSRKTKGKMYEEYGWKILSDAGKAIGLPLVIGSHTMRKSFANIAACVDKSCIDMNSITKIQGLLNHSDQRVTMKYLGAYQDMFDRARMAVSDFVLGRTDINEIVAGDRHSIDEVYEKMNEIEKMIIKRGSEE